MSDLAPSPSSSSSSSESNASDSSNGSKAPPPASSSSSPPPSRDESSRSPPSSGSGGSRSNSSEASSSSGSPPSPPSHPSPPPPSQSPPSSSPPPKGGSTSSPSPPPPSPPPGSSSQSSGGSSPTPPPGNRSPSPPQPSTEGSWHSPPSPSTSTQTPPSKSDGSSPPASPPPASPSPPQQSNSGQSGSQPSPQSPPPSSPAPPTNSIAVPVSPNGPPRAQPPPTPFAVAPAAGNTTSDPTPSSQVADGPPGTSDGGGGGVSSSTNAGGPSKADSSHVAAAIAAAAIAGLLFAMVAIFLVVSRRRKKRAGVLVHHNGTSAQFGGSNPSGALYSSPPGASAGFSYGPSAGMDHGGGGYYQSGAMEPPVGSMAAFSYEELMSITSNFSRDNVVGEGGFGCVFKGWLADGKCVAVKQLRAGSGQGEREFRAEVEIISRVHHRHLVSLVGYCIAQHHRMLIYEFVPNGTLEHHLHGRGMPVMDWPTRLRIAIGAAKGLAYLHEDCHPRIIHRDIKSSNILLDYSFEAQVADFGLAKLTNDTHTHVSTRIMGTFGYLAPEYASSGKLTDRSDVFSFGVVLLELITGRKPVDQSQPLGQESLVEWARPLLAHAVETGDLDALVDARLEGAYDLAEITVMVEAAAACVRHSAPKRPRMVQVMRALDHGAGAMSDLSNGVRVRHSQTYGSGGHHAAVQQLRQTAFASEEFTGEFEQDYGGHGGNSETQPMNRRPG